MTTAVPPYSAQPIQELGSNDISPASEHQQPQFASMNNEKSMNAEMGTMPAAQIAQPASMPMAAAPVAGQGLAHAMPIQSLNMGPAPVDCPACHQRVMTRVEYHSGNTTLAWAAVVCCLTGFGCIPFLITSLKDVVHHCSHCGARLATWHRSGRLDQHIHG